MDDNHRNSKEAKKDIFIINASKNTKEMRSPNGTYVRSSRMHSPIGKPFNNHEQKEQMTDQSTVSDILDRFSVQTTIPGVLHVVTRRRRLWQIFWFVMSMAGLAMSMYQSYDVMMDYISGRTIQVVDYNSVKEVQFPSVTVCSNILLDSEIVSEHLAKKFCDGSNISACFRTSRKNNIDVNDDVEEYRLRDRLMRYQSRFTQEDRQRFFYASDFLFSCTWELFTCDVHNQDHVYMFNNLQNGMCITINIGIKTVLTTGQNGAMNLVFNMDRDSRKLRMNAIYASMWIHPPGTSASMYADNGATVYPGDKININYMMQNISRVPSRKCVDMSSMYYRRLNPYYSEKTPYKYSTRDCQFTRQDTKLRIPKKCYHPSVFYKNITNHLHDGGVFCTSLSEENVCTSKCYNFTEKEVDDIRASCKSPCQEIIVKYNTNTVSLWLENMVEKSMLGEPVVADDGSETLSTGLGSEIVNESVAILQISPWSNIIESITEEYKYSYSDFLGILGGNFGLWIGLSLISLTELIELVVVLTSRALTKRQNRTANEKLHPKHP